MRTWISGWRSLGLSLMVLLMASNAHALSAEAVKGMSVGDTDARVEALGKALTDAADERTAAFIQALSDDAVKVAGEQVLVVRDGAGTDPVTGQAVPVPDTAEDVINNNRMRTELDTALAALKLFTGDTAVRLAAVANLIKEPSPALLPLLDKALADEKNTEVREQLALARSAALLSSEDPAQRLAAAKALADSYFEAVEMIQKDPKKSFEIMGADVKQTAEQFENSQKYLRWQDRAANQKFFAGEHAAFTKEAAELLLEAGVIRAIPDLTKLADTRFIK